ncbi:aldo/keto reductase [Sphingobacterium spiritivorum]|nr:aldo/keto reductase [Sphingobacterium spiritivorum]
MRKVRLGQSDLEIVPLVFGGNVFGWTLDEKQSFDILDAYLDKGFDAVDTSNQYSHWVPGNTGGESETIIGNWLKKSGGRDKIVLMTKVGGTFPGNPKPNTSKKHILEQVDVSLKRLQTDYIDLYQTHYDDESIPVEETLEAYEQLVKEGKVRWIGTSNMSAQRVLESIELSEQQHWPRYQTLQPEYNLFSREK